MTKAAWLSVLLLSGPAFAAGFALPEQDARSLGMAGTGVGSAEGAATIFYNPGATAFEDGMSAEVSLITLVPLFDHENGGVKTEANTRPNFAPTLFVEAPVMEHLYLGLGAYSAFGARITWPSDFAGRFEGSSSTLTTFQVNPTVSYRINDALSVGAGVDIVRAAVELDRQLDFVSTEGSLRLGGGTWGVGGNAGLQARLMHERMRLGVSYRSAVSLSFDGRADFTVPPELQSQLKDQDVRTSITLPHVISAGWGFAVTPRFSVAIDASYTTWSVLKSIDLHFDDPSLDQSLRRDWVNTITVRGGVEYALSRELKLRGGVGFDPTPSPSDTTSPSLPDASRILASVGVGYRLGNFNVDASYMFADLLPNQTTGDAFPGTYTGMAHVAALTVSFRQ
ncbi:MAG: OmpP1/FadL family transporter [Myxococcaceae bacterium]